MLPPFGTEQVINIRTVRRRKSYPSRVEMNTLVSIVSILECAILSLTIVAHLSNAILIPPRLYTVPPHHNPHDPTPSGDEGRFIESDQTNILSINEGYSKSVPIDSKSVITVNLNRPIPQDINVMLSVYSGPSLIAFDEAQHDGSKTSNFLNNNQYSMRLANSSTNYTIKYAANTFGDRIVNFHTNHNAGHAEIVCKIVKQPNITIDDSTAYISIEIYRNWNLDVIAQIVGWIYFFAWSISFYFQLILNYRRKSVVGLNFDFLALNLLGFTCYSIYNISLLFARSVQQEYYKRYTYSRIPVEYNDLFFALHAVVITILTVLQCCIYERGEQAVSLPAGIFLASSATLGSGLFVASLFNVLSILDVVFYLSYVKLVITIVKYFPQAFMNYKRKATTGWSIHNIILDFIGGSFSFMQMLLIAYNYNDWISIFGNFAKFGLGLISMIFDVVFLVQHYVLYRDLQPLVSDDDLEDSSNSVPSPVISQSVRSANTTQQQAPVASDSDADGDGDTTERDD